MRCWPPLPRPARCAASLSLNPFINSAKENLMTEISKKHIRFLKASKKLKARKPSKRKAKRYRVKAFRPAPKWATDAYKENERLQGIVDGIRRLGYSIERNPIDTGPVNIRPKITPIRVVIEADPAACTNDLARPGCTGTVVVERAPRASFGEEGTVLHRSLLARFLREVANHIDEDTAAGNMK
jgi:hypothetical protein